MFAPILPSPIMPSCIACAPQRSILLAKLFERDVATSLLQGLLQRRAQLGEILAHALAEVHAQRAATALGEYREIAASLGGLDYAEGVFLTGNRKIDGLVAGNLQKHARLRAAFV